MILLNKLLGKWEDYLLKRDSNKMINLNVFLIIEFGWVTFTMQMIVTLLWKTKYKQLSAV